MTGGEQASHASPDGSTLPGKPGADVPVASTLDGKADSIANFEALEQRRRMVAGFCRLLGEHRFGKPASLIPPAPAAPAQPDPTAGIAPRVRQTLDRLLTGDSEKEIARHLSVSPHTIHVYVKALYRHFDVNSRGELLARFVDGAYYRSRHAAAYFPPALESR